MTLITLAVMTRLGVTVPQVRSQMTSASRVLPTEQGMNPGKAKIIKCPFCGEEKELMTLVSGNTCGARWWSDGKMIAPMLPQTSPVQKCPKCGKYYFEFLQPYEESENWSFELGEMSYQEWKKAYQQFLNDNVQEELLLSVEFWLIQAYNDNYRGSSEFVLPEEDVAFVAGIIKEYVAKQNWNGNNSLLLKAELCREAGEMEDCCKVLSSIDQETLQDFEVKIFAAIKEKMEIGDRRVFELSFL